MLQILGILLVAYAAFWVSTSTHETAIKIRAKIARLFGKE